MAGDAPGTAPENPPGPGRAASSGAPLALYRRYRPATFAEVRGQEHVTEPLRQALRNGRVHHAYLFSGPRGCGKTSSARILARSLNCVQGPTPDPCGVCDSCVALAPSGPGSIDVIEIDAASHGGVDDARDLRERAFYAPVSGRFKIYIIDEAHMVTSGGLQRPAQAGRGAAAAPEVRVRDDRAGEGHPDDQVAHAPLPVPAGSPDGAARPARGDPGRRGGQLRADGAAAGGPGGRGLGPRLAVGAGPAARGGGRRKGSPTSARWRCSATPTTACWTRWWTRSRPGTGRPCSAPWTGWCRAATTRAGSPPTCWTGCAT